MYMFLRARRVVVTLGAVAALGLLTACGGGSGSGSGGGGDSSSDDASATASHSAQSAPAGAASPQGTKGTQGTKGAQDTSASKSGGGSGRCRASQLRGHVGRNDPGAGQENFPLVVTNFSGTTCTLDGYPGAAFVDGSGKQLGPDPRRAAGSPVKITLAPGASAWAGLSFGNPEISGAKTATPTGILITPPDEKEPVKVDWTGGAVPVSDAANLTVFRAGNGG
ncbi:DUF4232 domain-containing protein [Streptomyces sp. NPDC048419]|uniref:DUF4232 domain-containing protein n=1 Tax=Streptomyces sp. NPDC048419 TaxID=3365547 RepID=UPI0037220FBF